MVIGDSVVDQILLGFNAKIFSFFYTHPSVQSLQEYISNHNISTSAFCCAYSIKNKHSKIIFRFALFDNISHFNFIFSTIPIQHRSFYTIFASTPRPLYIDIDYYSVNKQYLVDCKNIGMNILQTFKTFFIPTTGLRCNFKKNSDTSWILYHSTRTLPNTNKIKVSYHIINYNIIYHHSKHIDADLWKYWRSINKKNHMPMSNLCTQILYDPSCIDRSVYKSNKYQLFRMPNNIKCDTFNSVKKLIYPNISFFNQIKFIQTCSCFPSSTPLTQLKNTTSSHSKATPIVQTNNSNPRQNPSFKSTLFTQSKTNFLPGGKCLHSMKFFNINQSIHNKLQWQSIECTEKTCNFPYLQISTNSSLLYPSCLCNISSNILDYQELQRIETFITRAKHINYHVKKIWLKICTFQKSPSAKLLYSVNLLNIQCQRCLKCDIKLQKSKYLTLWMWCLSCKRNIT